ncbi:MAG: hypothetical protein JWN22_688 [Nocardioides sp.]|nr:hypothetical protein [Nocardioides sp.]
MHLTDGDRIRGLLGTYCQLIDAGDFAGLGALMARATLRTEEGAAVATGSAEVAALYADLVRVHGDGTPMTQHLVANTVFHDPHADGSVTATSSYVVLQSTPELRLQPVIAGTYVDTFARDEAGSWHFTERRFGIGRAGDLSHHLTTAMGEPS